MHEVARPEASLRFDHSIFQVTQKMEPSSETPAQKDTRSEPRYEASLPFTASLLVSDTGEDVGWNLVTLTGYTRNVSSRGLALVGPFVRLGYRYLMGAQRTLRVMLELPAGTIEIKAEAIHFQDLPPGDLEEGYIL